MTTMSVKLPPNPPSHSETATEGQPSSTICFQPVLQNPSGVFSSSRTFWIGHSRLTKLFADSASRACSWLIVRSMANQLARGRPRPRWATIFRWMSTVPPAIVAATDNVQWCFAAPLNGASGSFRPITARGPMVSRPTWAAN